MTQRPSLFSRFFSVRYAGFEPKHAVWCATYVELHHHISRLDESTLFKCLHCFNQVPKNAKMLGSDWVLVLKKYWGGKSFDTFIWNMDFCRSWYCLYIIYIICTVSTTIYAYVLCFFSNKKIVLYCALLYIIHLYNTILQLYKVLKYRNFNYYLHYTIQYTVYCVL